MGPHGPEQSSFRGIGAWIEHQSRLAAMSEVWSLFHQALRISLDLFS